ncbi:hypothetical protein [Limosilactobacillus ingluviei]|nr:hypothetical protein [Limosilactobacillus ingluviei]
MVKFYARNWYQIPTANKPIPQKKPACNVSPKTSQPSSAPTRR